jgi:hypothetical protein
MCKGCEQKLLVSPALYERLLAWDPAVAPYVQRYEHLSPPYQPLPPSAGLAERCHAAYLDASRP